MSALINILVTFIGLFGLVYGLGCLVAAVNPRNRGVGFFVNTLFAAAALTTSLGCAWLLAGRL